MIRDPRFDDIRPYYDEEIPAAMQRIADDPNFPILASYVFPGRNLDELRTLVKSMKTVEEFQVNIMWYVNDQIIRRSISNFTYSGLSQLDPSKSYLFVSNHRDIMLDASLLQNILHDNGFQTTEITFGANLMNSPVIIDFGKSNKMYRVERPWGMSMREFYLKSIHLSEYIRYSITQKHTSSWIAQRNGRTKDGNDATDQGVVKMLMMSRRDDKIRAISELNIVPVSVSYEWETCDYAKALELYQSRFEKYVKKQGEDMTSIISGINSFKGHVNISICEPITEEELQSFDSFTNVEFERAVCRLIDERIYRHYALSPNNFIAHDLRYGKHEFKGVRYDDEQKKRFFDRYKDLAKYAVEDPETLRDIFLGIYSNPVDNCLPLQQEQ